MGMNSRNEFDENAEVVLAAKSVAFGALAVLFQAEPTEPILEAALSPAVRDAFTVAAGEDATAIDEQGNSPEAIHADDSAAALFDELTESAAAGTDSLGSEYMRLFVGPHAPVAPPWESVYREPGRCLYNASTLAVETAYRELPFICGDAPDGPKDHVAFECSFLSACFQRALDALSTGNEAEATRCCQVADRFVRDHTARWIPEFAQSADTETTPFYATATRLLANLATPEA